MSYDVRLKTCSGIERLSWAQHIVLSAAAQVDYLPTEAWLQINVKHGVWRSLRIRGLLRAHRYGWETTEKGQEIIDSDRFIITSKHQQKERSLMNGKLPRYRVSRTREGNWAVIDRSIVTKMTDDVIETFKTRNPARLKAQELNLQDLQEKHATGDAA